MKFQSKLALIIALALVTSGGLLTAASAGHVRCGTVITTSTVLDSNVGPCSNNGIIIEGDNVVLDLNGHQVFGIGQPGDGAGILVRRANNATVKNGTVRLFDGGVAVKGGTGHEVLGITAKDNIGDAETDTEYGDGIALMSTTYSVVRGSTALHNGPYAGIGLYEIPDPDHPGTPPGPSTRNTVTGNFVRANNLCRTPQGPCDDDGIRLEPGVDFNVVSNNQVYESGLDGIAVFRTANDNSVVNNTVEHNGHHRAAHRKGNGIQVFSDRNLVQNNASFHNAADGIMLGFVTPRGLVRPAVDNRILDNRTGHNQQFDLHDLNPNCDNNVWRGNTYRTAFPACTTG